LGVFLRLKKIEIVGFKSFADKVVLNFHPGITGVVGPNGCGKSNIADAFRWVLGEQSAKSMRGTKMPDVIFAGTSTRKPLNYAEVTITMGDINGALPIEYDEVSVTRRLHRNGESEYFINRSLVRLKDVQSLFLDSGMGKDAYSIFEQGKIDQVINYSALERRYIFEEAAGILRFLQRKREALRKLELSDQNIERVKDIHQEVEKQIVVLEKQAEKAKSYKENKVKLEQLEKGAYLAKWDNLQKRSQDSGKREGELKQGIHELNMQIEKLQYKLQEAKEHLAEGEKALRGRSEEVYRTRSEKEIKSREKLSNQERIKEALAKEKRWQQDLEDMSRKRKQRQTESQQSKKQQEALEKELQSLEKSLQALRDKVQGMEASVSKLREQQQTYQRELMQLVQEESRIESDFKQTSVRLESQLERKGQLEEKKQRLNSQQEELNKIVKDKQLNLQQVSQGIDEQKKVFTATETELQELNKEIQETEKNLERHHRELTDHKARERVLVKMREDLEGFSSGSKRLLQEGGNPKSALHGKVKGLYELIAPQPGGELAVAVVMRPYSQTLVVENEADLKQVIAFAKQHKLKDFSLFCLAHADENYKSVKGLTTLFDKVAAHAAARHFFKGIYACQDSEKALELMATEGAFLLEDGGLIDHKRVVFFSAPGENNAFAREAEIKTLEKRIKESEISKAELDAVLKEQHTQRTKLHNERLEMDKAIRKTEMTLVEANFALQRAKGDLEKLKNEGVQLDKELQEIANSSAKLSDILKTVQKNLAEAKSKVAEKQKGAGTVHTDLESQLSALKTEQRSLQEKEAENHRLVDENRKALHALHVMEVKDLESLQQEKRLEEEIHASREQQAQFKEKTTEYEKVLGDVDQLLKEVMDACADLEKEVTRRKSVIEDVEAQLLNLRNKLKKIEGDLYQASLQSAQMDSTRQALEEELKERYQLSMEELRHTGITLEKTLEATEKAIRALRTEIDSAGDINMTSIEEFETHKTRYEFLNKQIDDMGVSKQELVQIISELDKESRKIFQETFEKVRDNFQKNFKILFNGGEADLQFTDTGDVLEAGIEIIARPPGKQMRSINLLSGGEKCLTAMALLFAIFEVKPAPYCILDEIDAPLDDTNVDRFVNVVKQFIDRCQFIIITHNKRTMAIADMLYGVSMEEKGVSKMLSIEFARAQALVD